MFWASELVVTCSPKTSAWAKAVIARLRRHPADMLRVGQVKSRPAPLLSTSVLLLVRARPSRAGRCAPRAPLPPRMYHLVQGQSRLDTAGPPGLESMNEFVHAGGGTSHAGEDVGRRALLGSELRLGSRL